MIGAFSIPRGRKHPYLRRRNTELIILTGLAKFPPVYYSYLYFLIVFLHNWPIFIKLSRKVPGPIISFWSALSHNLLMCNFLLIYTFYFQTQPRDVRGLKKNFLYLQTHPISLPPSHQSCFLSYISGTTIHQTDTARNLKIIFDINLSHLIT